MVVDYEETLKELYGLFVNITGNPKCIDFQEFKTLLIVEKSKRIQEISKKLLEM